MLAQIKYGISGVNTTNTRKKKEKCSKEQHLMLHLLILNFYLFIFYCFWFRLSTIPILVSLGKHKNINLKTVA